jgi:hypothetical protein
MGKVAKENPTSKQECQQHSKRNEDVAQVHIQNAGLPNGENFLPKIWKHRPKVPDLSAEKGYLMKARRIGCLQNSSVLKALIVTTPISAVIMA